MTWVRDAHGVVRHRPIVPSDLRRPIAAAIALAFSVLGVAWSEAAPRSSRPFLEVEAGPWARAGAVVVIQVEHVRRDPRVPIGPSLVRGTVRAVLKQPPPRPGVEPLVPGAPLVVGILGGRPAGGTDAQASVPLLAEDDRGRHVVFLAPSSSASAWEAQALFSAEGLEGEQKVAALQRLGQLSAIEDPVRRRREVLEWLFDALREPRTWTRENAAREFVWIARHHPAALDAPARLRLRRAAAGATSRAQREYLVRALSFLSDAPPPRSSAATSDPSERWRAAMERAPDAATQAGLLISRHREAVGSGRAAAWRDLHWAWSAVVPEARLGWLRALRAGAAPDEAAVWRAYYAREADHAVLEALVRAVGLTGGEADVPWLAARVERDDLWHAATLALARIRTATALGWLRRERAALVERGDDAERVGWLDHLLSEDFAAADQRTGAANRDADHSDSADGT